MLQGVIFDMDGVLVNNTAVHIRAFDIFCRRYGVEGWRERLNSAFGKGNDDIMRLIMPAEIIATHGIQALADEKEAIYREIYAPEIVPNKGLVEMLDMLREAGVKCAVGSSGCLANVDFVLEKCGIANYFDTKICGDMVSRCKPDPEIYLLAAKGLGLLPKDCLVFEDAKAGVQAAKSAGIQVVVALTTTLSYEEISQESGIDRIISDFTEIENIEELRNLNVVV